MNEHDHERVKRTERPEGVPLSPNDPSPDLEDRTVALLRRKGVLRRPGRSPWLRYAGMAAAVGGIFAAGMATGMSLAPRAAGAPEDSATRVQRTGSEYVEALAAVETLDPTGSSTRDMALATFAGAAREWERLTGGEALAKCVTSVLAHPGLRD